MGCDPGMAADTEPEQRPNSRKGIPNGVSKHYGDSDKRFKIDTGPEDALSRLMRDQSETT